MAGMWTVWTGSRLSLPASKISALHTAGINTESVRNLSSVYAVGGGLVVPLPVITVSGFKTLRPPSGTHLANVPNLLVSSALCYSLISMCTATWFF